MKSRQGYKGYVIVARSCELQDGGFAAEFSVEEHDRRGFRAGIGSRERLSEGRAKTSRPEIGRSNCCTNCCTIASQNPLKRTETTSKHFYFTTTYARLGLFVIGR